MDPLWTAHDRPAARRTYRRERKLTWGDAPFWAPHLFSEPSFRLSRGPKRSPSLNFARVGRAGVVDGLSCCLPMRFISIAKPHVHHERISVVGAFDPSRSRLWFQSHRDKSHFPNCPMVAKNLRLAGLPAFRSGRRRRIAPGTQSKRPGFVPRSTQSLPPAVLRDSFWARVRAGMCH